MVTIAAVGVNPGIIVIGKYPETGGETALETALPSTAGLAAFVSSRPVSVM